MKRTDSEKFLLELNFRNEIVDERQENEPVRTREFIRLLPETIIDKRTLDVVEIHDLFKALNHTVTLAGSARLFHSLVNPLESIELVYAKQDSFCEVQGNHNLKERIADFLHAFQKGENSLFKFLNAHMHPLLAYKDYRQAMAAIQTMMAAIEDLPPAETVYLDSLIKSIKAFGGSPVKKIVDGQAYRTLFGVKCRQEKKIYTPAIRFRPSRIGFGSIWPFFPGIYFGLGWMFEFMNVALAKTLFLGTSYFSALGILYGLVLKPMIDYETGVLPVRKRLLDSNRFASAIEAVAAIDELFSFVRFAEEMPHPTVLPEITNEESHIFVARGLRNPIRAKNDPAYVANDINLTGNRVLFITGPNSGGKTTFCKTIAQNQILAQIGAPVVAEKALINMADNITYQAPCFDTLADPEGRFGTELKVTRDIFYSATPRSLTILDEIAEGTTTHEKMDFSVEIMKGFHAIGNTTLLVTHSYELVERFQRDEKGQYLQVEFDGSNPTHKMVAGISRDSQALRVARKIGFAPEDIRAHLEKNKYL